MAKEIKSDTVDPSKEDDTINEWQSFGWEFVSTQEVKTSDSSHLERRGDTIYNVTKSGDHYVKLTFQRDPERQNYAELVSLEEQYNDVLNPGYMPRLGRIIMGVGIALLAFGLIAASGGGGAGSAMFIVPGIAIIALRVMLYSKKKKQWETDFDNWRSKRAEILAKAKFLS